MKKQSLFIRLFSVAILVILLGGYAFGQGRRLGASSQTGEQKQGQKYDIAAFVWPSYHPDDRAKIFWPDGIGEWQTVISNKPEFEGHQQPRFPLWGYINEADPYVAKKFADARPGQVPLITINSWNEWTETSYLQPCTMYGYGYLEAIKRVFVPE